MDAFQHLESSSLEVKNVPNEVTTSTFIGILFSFLAFACLMVAFGYMYYRRVHRSYGKSNGCEQPLTFNVHRRPTAIKSPTGAPPQYLKKIPSSAGCLNPAAVSINGVNASEQSSIELVQPASSSICTQKINVQLPTVHGASKNVGHITNETAESIKKSPTSPPYNLGSLVFKLQYKREKNSLVVTIVECKELPARDARSGTTDPYVKLQLLPEKQHKVKTRVLRKTQNPVYDEDFTFYGIDYNQLPSLSLQFVVLSFDRYSKDDIVGEVFYPLSALNVEQCDQQHISVTRQIQPRSMKGLSESRGELLLSLCWQPAAKRLTVVILKARNLPKMDVTGLADPYVKIYVLYKNQRIAKKKTHVKKRTLNPVFNESFVFDIPCDEDGGGLNNVVLEFCLLDWDRVTRNDIIGKFTMGGPKCTGPALHHWKEVCRSARRQIADWHKLK